MDIGTLTGHIALEDQLTGKLSSIVFQVKKFAEDFDGALGGVAIGVGVVAAAVVGLAASIAGLGVKGSTILGVEDAFNRLAEAAGSTGEALIGGLDRGLKGTVDSMEQMQAVSRAMTAGVKLTADEMELLGSAARAIGKATGTDAAQGLERLSTALATGQTRTLRMAGLVVDLSQAESKYAAAHGLVVTQLTVGQTLEAKRAAILEATRGYVDRLGDSEVSFKERLQQTTVAIGNWFDNLSKGVAKSEHVSRALDALQAAIERAFGGSSQDLLDWALKWVNRFADAVATYGPPVIQAFGWIYNRIKDIWKAVTDAWNIVPDWLKNIVRDAALTTAALYLTTRAVSTLASSITGLPSPSGSAGGWRTLGNDIGTMASAAVDLGRVLKEALPLAIATTVAKFTALRLAINSVGVGIAAAALWPAVILAAVAASYKLGEAGYQGWKLWQESTERAASATRQLAHDQANLERLNTAMGASFKDVNEAAAAYRTSLENLPPPTQILTAAEEAAAEAAKYHAEQVDKLYQTIAGAAATIDVTSEAFNRLTLSQKNTLEAQALLIPMLDAHIARGIALTATEKAYYETVITSRLNLEAQNLTMLATQGITLERIQSMKAMGMAETEIAQALGTTVIALKEYSSNLIQLKTLTEQLGDQRLKMTGTATDAAVAGYQKEYQVAVDALDKTSIYYAQTMSKLAALRDERTAAEGSSWAQLAAGSQEALRQMADAAQRDYERMLYSGLHFTREALDVQREKVRQLQWEAHHLGQTYESAMTQATNATNRQTDALNKMNQAAKRASGWTDAAGNPISSITFTLNPGDPGYQAPSSDSSQPTPTTPTTPNVSP